MEVSLPRKSWLPCKLSRLDESILKTFAVFLAKNKKPYVVCSQAVLLKQLAKYYHTKISLRTVNYHLKFLEQKGYIRRVRRISQAKNGRLVTLPTLYWLLDKTQKFLRGLYAFGRRLGQWFKDFPKQVIIRERLREIRERQRETELQKPVPMPDWAKEVLAYILKK